MLHTNDLIALFVYSNLNTNSMDASSKLLGGLLITLATVSCITGNKNNAGRKNLLKDCPVVGQYVQVGDNKVLSCDQKLLIGYDPSFLLVSLQKIWKSLNWMVGIRHWLLNVVLVFPIIIF